MPTPSNYGAFQEKLKLATSGNGSTSAAEEAIKAAKKAVKYRECLKNHAASIGGHALDGCGEFMPSGEDGTMEALKCAACDCHRNFHRREVEGEPPLACADCSNLRKDRKKGGPIIPPLAFPSAPSRASAPLIMHMALNSRPTEMDELQDAPGFLPSSSSPMKKRFRTKFSADQKEKMFVFAEKLGWRIQRHDETAVQEFCAEVGVKRHVLKVWMHNNKNTFAKKPLPPSPTQLIP
ncbi:hypothetical protein O6H91_07G051800 [Diphasiastrum complanatum]|nr:hypothetical protein O6H91_07G051800 [Diphasiastrum complanatum]